MIDGGGSSPERRDGAAAEARMTGPRSLTFSAWRPGPPPSYVSAAEMLVRLGSFGLELTWRVRIHERGVHPELEALIEGPRVETLLLLALLAPRRQLIDADFDGYAADGALVVELQEFDSSAWDVRTRDPWLLDALPRWFPDAAPSPPSAWGAGAGESWPR
ncbi:hypothetical protein [Streptomyces sp. NPDC051000]|uniref:hypothetical protein n=1 Tax=Streptomyces sp. NPDC051000 TaxID=3155520 RepID=UPI0033DCA3FE